MHAVRVPVQGRGGDGGGGREEEVRSDGMRIDAERGWGRGLGQYGTEMGTGDGISEGPL
jgi:hypothetical protein